MYIYLHIHLKQTREYLRTIALGDLLKPEHYAERGGMSEGEVGVGVYVCLCLYVCICVCVFVSLCETGSVCIDRSTY